MTSKQQSIILGVDTGGTFTDCILLTATGLKALKLLSTPDDPSQAIIRGVTCMGETPDILFHGTTVATNALLEGKFAATALVTTKGFRDILLIGRQQRPDLYALAPEKTPPLVPEHLSFEVDERIGPDGRVITPLTDEEARRLTACVVKTGVTSVAICLLHSYANPAHEKLLAECLAQKNIAVSPSHKVLKEFREYERASTTAINAAVSPVMDRYLDTLEKNIPNTRLKIMQSNGGSINSKVARELSVRTILSGPAGGVAGAFAAASKADIQKIITFDMGGTSTDVSLCNGSISWTAEGIVRGWPVKTMMTDIHTVGAGGGSIAWIDKGGALRVGPESSGAAPGPACYGFGGTDLTVTDANFFLGRLPKTLGDEVTLDMNQCRTVVEDMAARTGMAMEQLAAGVLSVAESVMAGALRVVSVERGHDPGEFTLVPFGGAGGLHACALAEELAMDRIFVPCYPGLLSALGIACSDTVVDVSQTLLVADNHVNTAMLNDHFKKLASRALEELANDPEDTAGVIFSPMLDVRYQGQSFELTVPFAKNWQRDFHQAHEKRYGVSDVDRSLEIVTLRMKAVLPATVDFPSVILPTEKTPVPDTCEVFVYDAFTPINLYQRQDLPAGFSLQGPALVIEAFSTFFLAPGWTLTVDSLGNMLVST